MQSTKKPQKPDTTSLQASVCPNSPAADERTPCTIGWERAGVRASRRRTGKIARLPREHREFINLILRDGTPYSKIIQKLAQRGYNLDKDHISRWNAGGYQDWIQEQAWLEEMRTRLDFAKQVVNQPNANLIDEASLRIAVTQMYNLLLAFDPLSLKTQLSTQPTAYSRILGALCKITDSLARSEVRRAGTRNPFGLLTALQPSTPPPTTPSR